MVELADYLKIKKFSVVGVSGGGPYVAVCGYKIPNSELFIDPDGVHLSRYNFEDKILKTLTN